MPIGYIVDVEFLWGFQANVIGLSKTPPSFYYPPPTTFLGALAEALAKHYKLGEEKGKELIPKISQNLLAVGVKPVNCFPIKYEDINRLVTIRKVGVKDKITGRDKVILAPHPEYLEKSFDAPARGKTILVPIDNDSPKLKWFMVLRESTLKLNGLAVELSYDVFWKIHRLGSKESRVSVVNVVETENLAIGREGGITNYSFPLIEGVTPEFTVSESWEYEIYVKPFGLKSYSEITNYIVGKNTIPYLIPLRKTVLHEPKYRVKLGKNLALYRIGGEAIVGYG